jgi:hypothetical protein
MAAWGLREDRRPVARTQAEPTAMARSSPEVKAVRAVWTAAGVRATAIAHLEPISSADNLISMPEFAKSRSMNALDVPALGRTRRAVASLFT